MRKDLKAPAFKTDLVFVLSDIGDIYFMSLELEIIYSLFIWIESVVRLQETPIRLLCLIELQVLQIPLKCQTYGFKYERFMY